jgi:hypothetical protein
VSCEYIGLRAGKWSYNDRMPIVPIIGLGAWPVLQLTLLTPLAFWITNLARQPVASHFRHR